MSARAVGLAALVLGGAALVAVAARSGPGDDRPSLAPAWQLVGRATQTADRAMSQASGIDEADEGAFGDELVRSGGWVRRDGPEQELVDRVLADLTTDRRKPFVYRGFVADDPQINAFAMPGGVIVVTTGLLRVMPDEAVACVVAHEVGHVELSHTLDGARSQIRHRGPLAEIAGALHAVLMRPVYSQAAEAEADTYAFAAIAASSWDKQGCVRAFEVLAEGERSGLRRELGSHPPAALRVERARAAVEL